MTNYQMTRTKPDGTTVQYSPRPIRECGKIIYFWLADNGYKGKAMARTIASLAEKDRHLEMLHNTWTIEKEPRA